MVVCRGLNIVAFPLARTCGQSQQRTWERAATSLGSVRHYTPIKVRLES